MLGMIFFRNYQRKFAVQLIQSALSKALLYRLSCHLIFNQVQKFGEMQFCEKLYLYHDLLYHVISSKYPFLVRSNLFIW